MNINNINNVIETKLFNLLERLDDDLLSDECKFNILLLNNDINTNEIYKYVVLGWYVNSIIKNDI